MSQSIFIPSLCSPDDLQCCSLLIPSASPLWLHYKPHIYLIELSDCLPGLSMCTLLTRAHMWVYYLTLAGKMRECNISPVTYLVSCLPTRPAGQMLFCTRSSRGSEGLDEFKFSIFCLFVMLFFFVLATTATIYRLCCYFALYLGFSLVSFTGSV